TLWARCQRLLRNLAIAVAVAAADLDLLALFAGEVFLPARRLCRHILGRGAAIALAGGYRGLDAQHLVDAAVDALVDRLEVLNGEAVEAHALLFGQGDDLAGDVVGFAERDIGLLDQ